ncbi:MAG: hypothetical protein HKO03_01710 [Acidimicrobiia bacterium]|nr:hypothetical protein [Acidimicrobiia bacterium]
MAIDYQMLDQLVEELRNIAAMRTAVVYTRTGSDGEERTLLGIGTHSFNLDDGFGERDMQRCVDCLTSYRTPAGAAAADCVYWTAS